MKPFLKCFYVNLYLILSLSFHIVEELLLLTSIDDDLQGLKAIRNVDMKIFSIKILIHNYKENIYEMKFEKSYDK